METDKKKTAPKIAGRKSMPAGVVKPAFVKGQGNFGQYLGALSPGIIAGSGDPVPGIVGGKNAGGK